MAKHASRTTVLVGKSKEEIERTLRRYGATGVQIGFEGLTANVDFLMKGYHIKILFPLPDENNSNKKQHEQKMRTRWRDATLAVKAKLVMVDVNISTFEKEFLSYMALPEGGTVGDVVLEQIRSGKVNLLMAPEVD